MPHPNQQRPARRRQSRAHGGRGRGRPQGQQTQRRRPSIDLSECCDLHITIGLVDELVRMTQADWETLRNVVILGKQDVLLRAVIKNPDSGEIISDSSMVIRGDQSFRYTLKEADPNRKLSLRDIMPLDDLRAKILGGGG